MTSIVSKINDEIALHGSWEAYQEHSKTQYNNYKKQKMMKENKFKIGQTVVVIDGRELVERQVKGIVEDPTDKNRLVYMLSETGEKRNDVPALNDRSPRSILSSLMAMRENLPKPYDERDIYSDEDDFKANISLKRASVKEPVA